MATIPASLDDFAYQRSRTRQLREKFDTDPSAAEKMVARFMYQFLPEKKAAKISPETANLAKVSQGFDTTLLEGDDPRRDLGKKILDQYRAMAPQFPRTNPERLLAKIALATASHEAPKVWQWQHAQDVSPLNYFKGAEEKATFPGYEEYRRNFQAGMQPFEMPNPIDTVTGAGAQTAFGTLAEGQIARGTGGKVARVIAKAAPGIVSMAKNTAIGAALGLPVGGPVGAAVGAGLGIGKTLLEWYMGDVANAGIQSSEWAQVNPRAALLASFPVYAATMGQARGALNALENATIDSIIASGKATASPTLANLIKDAQSTIAKREAAAGLTKQVDDYLSQLSPGIDKVRADVATDRILEMRRAGIPPEQAMQKAIGDQVIVDKGIIDFTKPEGFPTSASLEGPGYHGRLQDFLQKNTKSVEDIPYAMKVFHDAEAASFAGRMFTQVDEHLVSKLGIDPTNASLANVYTSGELLAMRGKGFTVKGIPTEILDKAALVENKISEVEKAAATINGRYAAQMEGNLAQLDNLMTERVTSESGRSTITERVAAASTPLEEGLTTPVVVTPKGKKAKVPATPKVKMKEVTGKTAAEIAEAKNLGEVPETVVAKTEQSVPVVEIDSNLDHATNVQKVLDTFKSFGEGEDGFIKAYGVAAKHLQNPSDPFKAAPGTLSAIIQDAFEKFRSEMTKNVASAYDKVTADVKATMSTAIDFPSMKNSIELERGFNKLTRLSEAGKITEEEGKSLYKQYIARRDELLKAEEVTGKPKKSRKGTALAIATAGLVPLATLLTEEEANALPSPLQGLRVAPYVVKGSVAKTVPELLTEMSVKGLTGAKLDPTNPKAIANFMNTAIVIPDISKITYKGPTKLWMNLASKGVRGDYLFGAMDNFSGARSMSNPQMQIAHAFNVVVPENTRVTIEAVQNILKDVPGYKSVAPEVMKATEGLAKGYAVDMDIAAIRQGNIHTLQYIIENETRKLGKLKGAERAERETFLKNAAAELETNKAELALLKETKLSKYADNWKQVMIPLAEQYPSVRIALAVEGEGMAAKDPWLRKLLTEPEIVAVGHLKKINDAYMQRAMEVGLEVIADRPYMHHVLHPVTAGGLSNEAMAAITPYADKAKVLTSFYRRSVGSKQLVPDVEYIYKDYAFDANKRIEARRFWAPGKKGGWEQFSKIAENQGWTAVSDYINSINRAFQPMETTTLSKWMKAYYAFEVARLVGMSVSSAFKHAVKLEANWSNFGIKESAGAFPKAALMHSRALASDAKRAFGMNSSIGDIQTETMRTYTAGTKMYKLINEVDPYAPPSSWYEKVLQTAAEKGTALINFTERFDRAHSFVSALNMAAKQGMTAEQAAYSVMDTIMKTNFLSGMHNPSWLRDPTVRAMMMFQGTPFKIWENRLLLASRGGKALSRAATETLSQLNGMRTMVKEGERKFKMGLIKDAFRSEQDIFGNANASQLLRKMLIFGTLIYGGKTLFDSDLSGHVLHVPGIKNEGGLKLSLNPAVTAAFEAKQQDDEFWLSSFWNKWLQGPTPVPAMATKIMRLSSDDIPEMYRDSKFRYLFGIPATKEE